VPCWRFRKSIVMVQIVIKNITPQARTNGAKINSPYGFVEIPIDWRIYLLVILADLNVRRTDEPIKSPRGCPIICETDYQTTSDELNKVNAHPSTHISCVAMRRIKILSQVWVEQVVTKFFIDPIDVCRKHRWVAQHRLYLM